MDTNTYIILLTLLLGFIGDMISKFRATKATQETNKKLTEVVEKLVETVDLHGKRLDVLEKKVY